MSAAAQHSASGDKDEGGNEWSGDHSSIPAPFKRIIDQREAAIVNKLGAVIQHLQQEIARSAAAADNSSDSQDRRDQYNH